MLDLVNRESFARDLFVDLFSSALFGVVYPEHTEQEMHFLLPLRIHPQRVRGAQLHS